MNKYELMNLEKEVFDEMLEKKIAEARANAFVKPTELEIQLRGLPIPPRIHESNRSQLEESLKELWQNPALQELAKSIKKPKRNRMHNYFTGPKLQWTTMNNLKQEFDE